MSGRKTNSNAQPSTVASSPLPGFINAQAESVTLAIKLQPRASRNEIDARPGPELRVRVTAPPVEAAANEALLRLLAAALDCPRGKVELIRGHTSRNKVVKVHGIPANLILKRLHGTADV